MSACSAWSQAPRQASLVALPVTWVCPAAAGTEDCGMGGQAVVHAALGPVARAGPRARNPVEEVKRDDVEGAERGGPEGDGRQEAQEPHGPGRVHTRCLLRGGEGAQQGPRLRRPDHLRVLPLHHDIPVGWISPLVR